MKLIATFLLFGILVQLVYSAPVVLNVTGLFSLDVGSTTDIAGRSRLAASLLAVDNINSNTRYNNSIFINFISQNTQRNNTLAAQFAAQGVASGTAAFVLSLTTPETNAVIGQSGDTPIVSSGANVPALSSSTTYPYFVRNIPSGADQTRCLAAVITAKSQPGSKVASVYTSDDAAPAAIANALFPLLPSGSPSLGVATGLPDPNTTAVVSFLSSSGANIIPLVSQVGDASKEAAAIPLTVGQYIIAGSDVILSSAFFAASNSNAKAQNAFACALSSPNSTVYNNFLAAYQATAASYVSGAPTAPDAKASYTYDLLTLIAEAALSVISSGGNPNDHAQLLTAIRAANFAGTSGQISFKSSSNDIAEQKDYQVKRISGTSFPTVGTFGASGVFVQTDSTFTFPSATTTSTTGPRSTSSAAIVSAGWVMLFIALFFAC